MARRAKPVKAGCPVTDYARAVVAGEVVAGRLVRLACERHLRDLKEGKSRGLAWDPVAALKVLTFFSYLRLPADGELDGKPFIPEPFQMFILGSLCGWKRSDGWRRFRTAYVEQGKGNGKTPLAAGLGLYGLVADGEAGAEVYSAATTREQAGILFRDAKRMAESSPALRSRLDIGLHNLSYLATDSFLRPVSSEHRGLDGKRPHMALIDEVHEHPTPLVVDKMRAGTKSRRQAMIFEITNSGHSRESVCWHHHQYSIQVLEGLIDNDAWFAYVCGLDPCEKCRQEGQVQPVEGCPDCDDWQDESVWPKANPGIDTILPRTYLREQVAEAQGMPTKANLVKRLNFCLWTEQAVRAIPMDRWDACRREIDPESLRGEVCYAGLDIGATSDFTALVLLFPEKDAEVVEIPADPTQPEGDKLQIVRRSYKLLPFFWLPERPVRRDERMTGILDGWRRQHFLKATPGEVVDYDLVLQDILKLSRTYNIMEFAFDRGFQGVHMGTALLNRFGERKVFSFPQGILSLNPPWREFQELLITQRLHHDGNPVMRWMAANTAAETRGGLSKPSKDKSEEKIDGITAAVMALGRAMLRPEHLSVYESRGIEVLVPTLGADADDEDDEDDDL